MSKQTRRKFTSAFKAKVALEAIKSQETLAELGKKFDVGPIVISKWKSELLDKLPGIFDRPGSSLKREKQSIRRSFTPRSGS